MNTQAINQEARINLARPEAGILHEQLALKRLKELELRERKRALRRSWLWRAPKAAALLVAALFKRTELARETAPGQPPVQWHEVERIRQMRALQML